jgi:DNA polymerase-3 subunit gamma/tau
MDYQVSARKYRPGTFDDVIGQSHVVQTLVNSIATKRIAHAYLFSGTRGVGKTTVARILAKALNCEQGPTGTPCTTCVACQEIAQGTSVDVIEIDGASNTSVDDVREIRENIKFTPFRGHYRVYIIDEVHMLSNSAFNALLKTLEEPPSHAVFIFATTEIHKIPATILSRCQHYNFRRIGRDEIIERLRHIAVQDGIKLEDRSFAALARASEGSLRDALSLLDQAVAFGGKVIAHADLETLLGAVPQELVLAMIQAVLAQDSASALRVVAQLLDHGHDLRAYCADIVEYLRNMLVVSVTSPQEWPGLIDASLDDLMRLQGETASFTPEQLQQLFTIFAQAEDALRLSAHPRFVLETAAVRATRLPRPMPPPGSLIEKSSGAGRSMSSAGPPPRPSAPASKEMLPNAGSSRSVPAGGAPARRDEPAARGQMKPSIPESSPQKTVVLDWDAFQEEVVETLPNIAPFLEMGRLVSIEGDLVTIGFSKQASVARAMLEKPDNMRTMALLCERLTGQPVRLRIMEQTESEPSGPTMAQVRAAKEQEQRMVLFEQARAHPVVKHALEIFGVDLADVRTVSRQKGVQE